MRREDRGRRELRRGDVPATMVDLAEMARQYMAGGVMHHLFPIPQHEQPVIVRGEGGHIWDADGKEYIDCYLGSAAATLGHRHPEVMDAVRRQLELGIQFYALTPPAVELARMVVEAVPCAERVKFANSGTEATLVALRLGRAFTGRRKILKFEGAYHGTHDWVVWATRHKKPIRYPYCAPDSLGVPHELRKLVLVAPFNDLEATASIIDEHKDDLAAVLAEPFLGNIKPKPGFLKGVRRLTRKHAIPLIFDEVLTGFRLALGGAQEYYDVVPDIAALGKALGGGFPIGAIVGRSEFMDFFSPDRVLAGEFVMYSGTFSGNPVSCAAAIATIDVLKRPGTYERLHEIGRVLGDGLREMSRRLGVATFVEHEGPTVNIWFTEKPVESWPDTWAADEGQERQFKIGLMKRGVWSPPGQKMFLSLAHTDEDLDRVLAAAETSMRALRA